MSMGKDEMAQRECEMMGSHSLGRCFPNCPICTGTIKWTSRDGRSIRVNKMEDSHLLNTIRFLQRNEERIRFKEIAPYLGMGDLADGAAEAFDNEVERIAEMNLEEICPAYEAMLLERDRRGLP